MHTKPSQNNEDDPEELDEFEYRHTCTFPGCSNKYKTHEIMKKHYKNTHQRPVEYKCTYAGCKIPDKVFCNLSALNKHIKGVHEKSLQKQCDTCGKQCSNKGSLTRHILSVHEKIKTKCSICSEEMLVTSLYAHYRIKHTDIVKIVCECGAELGDKKYLLAHYEQVHLKLKVKCADCNKMVLKYQMNKHQKTCVARDT